MANVEQWLSDNEPEAPQEFELATRTIVLPMRTDPSVARRFRNLCQRLGLPQGVMLEILMDVFEEAFRSERLKLSIYPVPRGVTYRADLVWLEGSDNGSRSG